MKPPDNAGVFFKKFNLQVYIFFLFYFAVFDFLVWTLHAVVGFFFPRGNLGPWDYPDSKAYLELR